MTARNQPSAEVESLLELCAISAAPEHDQVKMQRSFQLTIWTAVSDFVDFKRIRFNAVRQIGHHRLGSVIEGANWGPFEGSWYGAFFVRTNDEIMGKDFQCGLWQVVHDFENKFSTVLEPDNTALLIVGSVAVGMTGAPGRPARPSFSNYFQVPASFAGDIVAGRTALSASEEFKKLFPTEASPQPEWVPPPDQPTQSEIRRLRRRGWE